jgi:hypothetical protein
MHRRLFNIIVAVSLGLCAVTAACWVTGAVGERHVTAWRVWSSPEHSWFVRFDRQHLIMSEQLMVPARFPAGYAMDSTQFRSFRVTGPLRPSGGGGVTMVPGSPILHPEAPWFRKFRLGIGGTQISGANRVNILRVDGFYGAIEIPWWSLALLFSLCPAVWLFALHRARARQRQRHCLECGYDLRASPDRCPECGSSAATAESAG